ncbi:MAG: 4Fe-4S dicluster domain-containing protein [Candidatus Odinarchaeia archaeon]
MTNKDEQKVLFYDPELCSGCSYCMLACSYEHFKVLDYNLSNLWIYPDPDRPFYYIGIHCSHCDDPICMAACPVEAISKDEETGWVTIDQTKCIGCRTCNIMCPISAPWKNQERKVSFKCDFCKGDPKCAKFCPTGAISVKTRKEARELLNKMKNKKEATSQ